MVIDLTETQSLTLWEIKQKIKQMFTPFLSTLKHVSVNTGKNVTLNITARFQYKNIGFNSCSFHTSFPKALKSISIKRVVHKSDPLKNNKSSPEHVYAKQEGSWD